MLEKYFKTKKNKFLITGGTEGIGREIAKELIFQNQNTVICARTKDRLDKMKEDFGVDYFQIDLSKPKEVVKIIKENKTTHQDVDVLILNAAVTGIKDTIEYTLDVNTNSSIVFIDSLASELRKNKGRIVFLTSSQAHQPVLGHEHYAKSKKYVEDYLIDFSKKEENKNIQIFFIDPSSVDTKMNKEVFEYGIDNLKNRTANYIKKHGKLRNPETIGKIVAKMAIAGNKFNENTKKYDVPIIQNEIINISDKNINFEETNL